MYLQNIDLKEKKVLVRVDFNVPLNKQFEITDDTRIRAALPTIQYLLEQGATVILMSHMGRPQKKRKEDGSIDRERFTLKHLVKRIASYLPNVTVDFIDDTVGEKVKSTVQKLEQGSLLLLENTRFYQEESKGDEAFAQALASLADIYVNDAFGTAHRAHASTAVIAKYFTQGAKAFGFLMEKEVENAANLMDEPQRPFTAIVGGAKVSDKILLLERLVDTVDNVIVGGGMAYTLLKAQGAEIGNSLVELDKLEIATQLLEKAKRKGVNIYLPADSIVANDFAKDAASQQTSSRAIPKGWMGLDIGEEARKDFREVVLSSKSLLWNGPMGVFEFEAFAQGTNAVAEAVVEATQNGAFSLVGGGDSVAALNQLDKAKDVSYVSTGGGAMLKLLEGGDLPGVNAIKG